MNIVMVFLPKEPSAVERAISKMVESVTKVLEENHKESMNLLSTIGRNQFFLHSNDKIQMLEQLTRAELVFNGFNMRSTEHICGPDVRECVAAYRDWIGVQNENLNQLVEDGPANAYNDLWEIGYNFEKIGAEVELTKSRLVSFSKALEKAVSLSFAQK